MPDVWSRFSQEVQQRAKEMRATVVRSLRFSDGLVVYTSLIRSPENNPLRAVYDVICACGSLMLLSLAWGHPIRGGIDIGTGIEADEQLYGPAVVKAYELESSCHGAEFPRIVVGKTLTDYLAHEAGKVGDVWVQINAQLASAIREMLAQDADGHTIIDYLGAPFKKKFSSALDPKQVHKAREFAARSLEHFKQKGDEKLTKRYQRLVDYFERKVHVWLT